MESASTPDRVSSPIEPALLAAAAREAAAALREPTDPTKAIDSAVEVLHRAVTGLTPSLFMLEQGRFWLVAQRGHSVVPDGVRAVGGVMGRAVRLGKPQLVPDVTVDPDYFAVLPGVVSELAIPLTADSVVIGALNLESGRALPDAAATLLRPLTVALSPVVDALRSSRTLDLAGLARLFVHLGSIRDPAEIAMLAATSLSKILRIDASQVVAWDEPDAPMTLASWCGKTPDEVPFSGPELDAARALVDPSAVCQVLDLGHARGHSRSLASTVWLPLRVNGKELGALVGRSGATAPVDSAQLDTAAVLAAHVAASLDSAFALRRERRSAVTDSLTGILNRRGLEERLEVALGAAQEDRVPLSILVFDCDDFKDINDRAGHEFGDTLLQEVADALGRSLPTGAEAARLGGDEFVVMLPETGADAAEALGGQIKKVLADGLTDAGFPLRISAGISTYPFDGAGAPELLRAADQALYAAKSGGKDRVASFRELTASGTATAGITRLGLVEPRSRGRTDSPGSVLADAVAASKAIDLEESADGVCSRLCKSLVFVVGATACLASRVTGDFVVDAAKHSLREVSLGEDSAYRIVDFPLTAEVLRTGRPSTISFAEGDVDPAEAFILRELGMNAVLLLPLKVAGRSWGLVELYEMRLRTFTEDEIAVAGFLTMQAERRLEVVARSEIPRRPSARVYEPPQEGSPRDPRTR
ncbi:MAG TPA: diguanylate cyclase [Gaiellaceae bacterium]|nr:diguanylate cyclase [Gaiellaceae bacterium]